MKRMTQQAGIENEGGLKNTFWVKRAAQSLRGLYDPMEISELTAHANLSSIQPNSRNSLQTQREICNRLAERSSTTVHNNLTNSVNVSKDESQQVSSNIFNLSTLNSCQVCINFQKCTVTGWRLQFQYFCKCHHLLELSLNFPLVIYRGRYFCHVRKSLSRSISISRIYNQSLFCLPSRSSCLNFIRCMWKQIEALNDKI